MTPPTKSRLLRTIAGAAALIGGTALSLGSTAPATASPFPDNPPHPAAAIGTDHRTIHADGVTYTPLLAATRVLPADGDATAVVAGTGYNRGQGIYVGFCVIPPTVTPGDPATYTHMPGPCPGGKRPTDGSSRRITDSDTGTPGITLPYKPGGSFLVTLQHLKPEIVPGEICGENVQCAIVTLTDLTAPTDRRYDLYVPVEFH
ncbi:hypothetical protein [Streptomyces griseorubiginosus]|uniref:hypothetical protein n=1 Tax=Streptomyces griseorubiginosus TaxID=67304 RepID=UPI001AD761EF|nr:hypothetical protein [Streptomyces griseorubiginosus]MBO4258129.1 hypothetical protein [Streptomyces griseorubiginosus]